MSHLDRVVDWAKALREAGVGMYEGPMGSDHVRLELFPSDAREGGAVIPREMLRDAAGEPEKCACGHDETTHDPGGLCLLGCAEHVCRRTTPESAHEP